MSNTNDRRRLRRQESNIKSAQKTNGKPTSKSKQLENKADYSVNKSRVASGTARSNQQAINGINVEIEDIWSHINLVKQNLQGFDKKMETYDKEDVQPIAKKQDILLDIMLNICDELEIDPELEEDELKLLGLTYDAEGEDDADEEEGDDNDALGQQSELEPNEGERNDETEDD